MQIKNNYIKYKPCKKELQEAEKDWYKVYKEETSKYRIIRKK